MISEKGIALRYLKEQKKRSLLMLFGVILAIALISAVFSILNAMIDYEVKYESESGVWHVLVQDSTSDQARQISKRIDITDSGSSVSLSEGVQLEGIDGMLVGCDAGGTRQLNAILQNGRFPKNDNEIALEQWVVNKVKPGAKTGDSLSVKFSDGISKAFTLSGILKDNTRHKGDSIYRGIITLAQAEQLVNTDHVTVMMQVRKGININTFVNNLASDYHLDKKNIVQHTSLLAALGRSDNTMALQIYLVGAFLSLLVIFSAIMMIYNSFNISVTQRIRQFGLLRAMGATPKQIRSVVRSEALFVSIFGVIPGLLLGIIATAVLMAILRYAMPEYFGIGESYFYISWIALLVGAITGVCATVISSLMPARKAGKVSPIEAITQTSGRKQPGKKSAQSLSTRILPIEFALSLRRLLLRKRSFFITSLSLSFGILLLLCFSPLTDLFRAGAEHNYDLGDIYVASGSESAGFSNQVLQSLSKTNGIKNVSAKRVASIDATFSYDLLGKDYRDGISSKKWLSVQKNSDGMIKASSKSTLIGVPDRDLHNFKSKLVFGDINPDQLNRENGVILVLNGQGGLNLGDLRPGNFIFAGGRKLKICGIIKSDAIMYIYNENPLIGIYTTNRVFESCSSVQPNLVTMTLKTGSDSSYVTKQVQQVVSGYPDVKVGDQHDAKSVAGKLVLVGDIFVYGFIAVIALIGILNIINTMSTNILVRTREIGLLRAGGMTMGQVTSMIAGEAALYGLLALIIGLAAGIPLEHTFFNSLIKRLYGIPWSMPWNLVILSSAVTLIAVMSSIASPLRYIKQIEITTAVTIE